MSNYQVIARKYRPQCFNQVIGQSAIVTTLINSIKKERVGHAYLFSGSRGTGKTTLARLFAKALNCKKRSEAGEPCNHCQNCEEISKSCSLDVLEIDGASHRGIEDIRKLHESIALLPASAPYKIYLIDEVHMLTKEAFNALLKSLEEPPSHVKFFFATTEPEKIPPTILSRCQRFSLNRLSDALISAKLKSIQEDLAVRVGAGVMEKIARLASGSLRDAESLFDELYTYYGNEISLAAAEELFGISSIDFFFSLDLAIAKEDIASLFVLAEKVLFSGKSLDYFVEELISHFRNHLLIKRGIFPSLTEEEKSAYGAKKDLYSEEACLDMLEALTKASESIKSAFSERTFLEMLFIKLARIPKKPSLTQLVKRLSDLEREISKADQPLAEKPLSGAGSGQPCNSHEKSLPVGESPPLKGGVLQQPLAAKTPSGTGSDKLYGLHKKSLSSGESSPLEEGVPQEKAPIKQVLPASPEKESVSGIEKKGSAKDASTIKERPKEEVKTQPVIQESRTEQIKKKSRQDSLTRFTAKEFSGALKLEENRG